MEASSLDSLTPLITAADQWHEVLLLLPVMQCVTPPLYLLLSGRSCMMPLHPNVTHQHVSTTTVSTSTSSFPRSIGWLTDQWSKEYLQKHAGDEVVVVEKMMMLVMTMMMTTMPV